LFLYYYAQIELPFAVVERRLMSLLSGLGDLAADSYREGETLRTKMGFGSSPSPLVAKKVDVTVGRPLRGESETEIPLTWQATGTPGLFPSMDAGIVVARLAPSLTQLAIRGSYEPPFGSIGRALDRTLFHRLAETSVKNFLDRIAALIEADGVLSPAATI